MDHTDILKAGAATADAKYLKDGIAYAVVPDGHSLESLWSYMAAPPRIRQKVTANTAAAFVGYFNRFAGDDSLVFADLDAFRIEGAIDYHGKDEPAFAEHSVSYTAPRSKEWQTWTNANGRRMSQNDFAAFIEDNLPDIRKPAGADVLEIAQRLEAKKKVEFVSAERLSDGAREFTYSETVDGSSRNGKLKVPETFVLGLPVFFGGDAYEVTARLRYRIHEGALQLWYDLHRHEHIEQDAFNTVVDGIRSRVNVDVFEASI